MEPIGGAPRKTTALRLWRLGGAAALALHLAACGVALTARWWWVGDVAASFAWQLGWTGALLAGMLLTLRRRGQAAVALLVGLAFAGPEVALWVPREDAGEPRARAAFGPTELTVASANLRFTNHDHGAFLAWVARLAPDVLVCQEATPRWHAGALAKLADAYPHRAFGRPEREGSPEPGPLVVLSRFPLLAARSLPVPQPHLRPPVEVAFEVDGRRVTLRAVHLRRPGRADRNGLRDAVLADLAGRDWPPASLLVGDLNVSGTSPHFRRLLRASGLRDSRAGFGRQPTFETRWPVEGLGLALDHVLVGTDVHVLERRTEELPGSDHRAVVTRLLLLRATGA